MSAGGHGLEVPSPCGVPGPPRSGSLPQALPLWRQLLLVMGGGDQASLQPEWREPVSPHVLRREVFNDIPSWLQMLFPGRKSGQASHGQPLCESPVSSLASCCDDLPIPASTLDPTRALHFPHLFLRGIHQWIKTWQFHPLSTAEFSGGVTPSDKPTWGIKL